MELLRKIIKASVRIVGIPAEARITYPPYHEPETLPREPTWPVRMSIVVLDCGETHK
jgi:hypothetical protein